ncbi:MAG: thioredoxin domain-containing protein [Balneolaceae bacterium]
MPNRLKDEKSPYLLQHAENPVDWHPWSEEAFRIAATEDKPVFLSVGYATCHWCHVMAHESFENEKTARLMNEAFVNIKVDREERPDIDSTYMTVCQLLTGHGGWPLTVIMTPDKRPFFAATYIPRESRFNRTGMVELIPKIRNAWENERGNVLQSADRITAGFAQTLQIRPGDAPGETVIRKALEELSDRYDEKHGGFGASPKFPSPHTLTFLFACSRTLEEPGARTMSLHTLEKMRLGGIWDHIGFGFHRYATDRTWLLPHFEKMLYDQAMLMLAYTEGWRETGDLLLQETIHQIAAYVQEQLTSPEGGFYSAEDADSEGEEGKFYLWTLEEIRELLSPEDAELFVDLYQIRPGGNFREEASGELTGANIPHLRNRPEKALQKDDNLPVDETGGRAGDKSPASNTSGEESHTSHSERPPTVDPGKRLNQIRETLKRARSKRVRPLLDDKILTDWNGLMISALSRAGAVLGEPSFTDIAERARTFINHHLMDNSGRLLHRYRDGEAAIPAMANDYAFLIRGLIDLYQATFDTDVLKQALSLNSRFLDSFWDAADGGFFLTNEECEELLGRQKEIYDGALPSSNSVAAMNLIELSRLTGETILAEKADQLFRTFSAFLKQSPGSAAYTAQALLQAHYPTNEVVICGDPDDTEVHRMIRKARQLKEPTLILLKTEMNRESLEKLAPYTTPFPVTGRATAYLCRDFTCDRPVYSAEELGVQR